MIRGLSNIGSKAYVLLMLVLVGCSAGPKYAPPELCIPKDWCHKVGSDASPACFSWLESLKDPELISLVKRARCSNPDLTMANLNLKQKNDFASKEDYRDSWISISSQVAKNYIEMRGFQARLYVLNSHVQAQKETLRLTEELLGLGKASSIDKLRVEEELLSLLVQKAVLQETLEKSTHHLSVLVGLPPCTLLAELCRFTAFPIVPCNSPIGTPCELVKTRPDIRKASQDYSDASQWGTQSYQARLALQSYKKSILNGLEEAENALASMKREIEAGKLQRAAIKLDFSAYAQTQDLYRRGISSSLDVIAAQKILFASETASIESDENLLLAYIDLYKALGTCP